MRNLIIPFIFFFADVALTASPADSLKIDFPVVKYQLENGLTVLLYQDSTIPLVSYHTWYRVGSRNEKPGVTGAAHMLEHMMFKGAKKYSGKDFERILHENGIVNNAFTSWDYTGFYENLPSHKLELIMDMEVDRMRDLALRAEDLKSELQVVGEERRWRVDNNPPSLLQEATFETLFRVHPYRWPVIGYMKDISDYTVEKLRHFYETYYVPNNAVLVIAGDIDIPKTQELVKKYYSSLPTRPVPETKLPVEPELKSEKRKTIQAVVQSTTVAMAYKSVPTGHPDSFALDLVANILGNGTSSRLHKELVYQQQKASSTSSYNITNADPGAFVLTATMKPGQAAPAAEESFSQAITRLQTALVSQKELQKAKNQIMKEYVDGLTTVDGKARALAVNEILFHSYSRLFEDLEQYRKVTVQDVRRVAQKYLKPEKKVVAILNPKNLTSKKETAP